MKKLITYILALIAFCYSSAAQDLVVNGGFDTSSAGWTATSGYFDPYKGYPGGCFVLSSPSVPTISQTIYGLIPGRNYAISGDYWIEGGMLTNTPSFGVTIDSVFVFEAAHTNWGRFNFSFEYQATTPSATLGIAAHINGTSTSYVIDNIVMQPIPSVRFQTVDTNIVLSWPTNALGFSLQTATNLYVTGWSTVTNTPVVVGTNYSVTLDVTQPVQFFSLKR